MGNEKQIEVTENDELIIPVEQLETTPTPGVLRVNPDAEGYAKLRAWAKLQGTIKIP